MPNFLQGAFLVGSIGCFVCAFVYLIRVIVLKVRGRKQRKNDKEKGEIDIS